MLLENDHKTNSTIIVSGSYFVIMSARMVVSVMPFREWDVAFRESASEFRGLLRKYPPHSEPFAIGPVQFS